MQSCGKCSASQPYNLGASLGLMDASKAGARNGADALLAQLR